MIDQLENIFIKLENHIKSTDFKGYDPHDALNSPILRALTFGNRFLGIIYLQLLKRCPINFRPILLIKKGINPKGFGLLISSYVEKYKFSNNDKDLKQAKYFADRLIANYSKGYSGKCWGYNFDWPNRNSHFKKGLPTIVNTSFIANGFLDLYEITKDIKYLDIAISSCEFIINDLNRYDENDSFCFSYTPVDNHACIHNANMLGASLLARVNHYIHNKEYLKYAKRSMKYSINHQNEDGSWFYGVGWKQKWIDSFHTGYNLLALNNYINFTGERKYSKNLKRGYEFYLNNFFTESGFVKYYHNKLYPLDCHAFAHAIITLSTLSNLSERSNLILEKVIKQTIKIFWNENLGYFYYKKDKFILNKCDYIRWVQIWMFYALLIYLNNYEKNYLV